MATGRGHRKARLVGPRPLRQSAAARVASHSDMRLVHFWPCQQNIQRPAIVPHAPGGHALAQQTQLAVNHIVGSAKTSGLSALFLGKQFILPPFALLNRVGGQHDKTILHQTDAARLIDLTPLAFH